MISTNRKSLPDVASENKTEFTALDWVGMEKIFLPLAIAVNDGESFRIPAFVSAFVSLDKSSSRGIHMSRLYTEVQKLSVGEFRLSKLTVALQNFLASHDALSSQAKIEIEFELPLQKKSLVSELLSWKNYRVLISAKSNSELILRFDVDYSSTCPASTALAREVNRDSFLAKFSASDVVARKDVAEFLSTKEGLAATPHAQRSRAQVSLKIPADLGWKQIRDYIFLVESVLKTPVQGAVKREDEQEFARLNGQNPMFCEDAARKIHQSLDEVTEITGYLIKVEHFESLHAHNAVSVKSKNFG